MSNNKRLDIQGVRAWAVIAVVIFHFFPSLLPWGYLGVDVFFVLSGFLISLVLERKACCLATYLDFYFKRFKRIFPLALVITLINVFVLSQNEEVKLVKRGMRSALYALFFATNYNVRDEGEDYFEALEQANDYFTHYWSLSVEIQFYVLAPLLLHILRPSNTHPARLLLYMCSVAICSLLLSLILPPQDAFSSTLSRLWQFTAGSMAFNLGNMPSEHQPLAQDPEQASKLDSSAPLMTLMSMPSRKLLYLIPLITIGIGSVIILTLRDSSYLTRLLVTAIAATLLVAQSTTPLLCHPFIQLLGDASYALYLLHWPVVCVLKDREVDDTPYLLATMLACITISIVAHLSYEKWYLTLSERTTVALVVTLYLACFSLITHSSTRKHTVHVATGEFDPAEALIRWEPGATTNFTNEQLRQMNKLMGRQLAESLTLPDCTPRPDKEKNDRFKFCYFPEGRGDNSFLIIGNSFALSPGKLVLKDFKKHYKQISIRAVPHCEPLIDTKHHMCKNIRLAHQKFLEDVEREQPDVLFLSARYENPGVDIEGNVTSDPIYLYMLDKLRNYEKIVKKKVFIMSSFPQLIAPSEVEKRRRKFGLPIEGFMPEAIRQDDEPMRVRIHELAKNCEKCVVYEIRNRHLNGKGQYMTVDPSSKLRYFEDSVHYTSVGLKVIEPVFTKMSKEFDHLLEAKYPENIFELKI